MTDTQSLPMVETSRDIEASPETVWRILTTPDLFSKWMDGEVTFEAKEGSPFRAAFPNFQTVVAGEIVTLDAAARHVAITWGVESGPQAEDFPAGCSLVELRVHDAEGGCRVDLTHSRIPSEDLAKQHGAGWQFHLSRLEIRANRSDLTVGLARTLDCWFAAWNERDADTRLATLNGCCADDVAFSDEWTSASGTELLSLHIGNCFMYMPDWTIERTGDAVICRGEAIVPWKGVGPGGLAIEGYNHVRADHDGTIRRVTGFSAT